MSESRHDEMLEYYQREITYLRKMGLEFAARYPKVAGRLELSINESPDPHIERLLESFAFLTARIQRNIDSELPEVTTALLEILYPHYLHPIPSMSIARFTPDPKLGKLTSAYVLRKHLPLFAQSAQGVNLRFRTCYPVELYPVEVSYAGFESTAQYDFLDTAVNVATVLRIRIQTQSAPLHEIDLTTLRFYLNGEKTLVNMLYEMLFSRVVNVALISDTSKKPIYLSPSSIRPVGFAADEEVLPYPGNSHPQYRLLQEYFVFPEKFLFFDVASLRTEQAGEYMDILILLDQMPATRLAINRETFQLGCTPIVNLFKKTSEPVRLDHRLSEYPLIADMRREVTTEIYSITSVSATSDSDDASQVLEPLYSYNHTKRRNEQNAYWYARRLPTGREDLPGTQMVLSLLDLNLNLTQPPGQTVFAHTLCLNRHTANQLPAGGLLQIEESAPIEEIVALTKPTRQLDPPLGPSAMWRVVSHLSLNYLSLSSEKTSLTALREILRLYDFTNDPSVQHQINGIREMTSRQVVRRIGKEAWRGFCRGTEINLVFDEELYVGSSAFLFASVLNQFFSLYTSINSFTQLVIQSSQRKGIWKRWEPMAGEQIIL